MWEKAALDTKCCKRNLCRNPKAEGGKGQEKGEDATSVNKGKNDKIGTHQTEKRVFQPMSGKTFNNISWDFKRARQKMFFKPFFFFQYDKQMIDNI